MTRTGYNKVQTQSRVMQEIPTLDSRIRIAEIHAHSEAAPYCKRCGQRMKAHAKTGVPCMFALYCCRNGKNYDFSGYLCTVCVDLYKGKGVVQTGFDLEIEEESKATKRRNKPVHERESQVNGNK